MVLPCEELSREGHPKGNLTDQSSKEGLDEGLTKKKRPSAAPN